MSELGQRLIQIVRQKAAENPDFVYMSRTSTGHCVYVKDGQPSCLIGQALWEAGVIDSSLEEDTDNTVSFTTLASAISLPTLDGPEQDWLFTVQKLQDVKDRWGSCVAHADKRYFV